jgi:hypothetical protein
LSNDFLELDDFGLISSEDGFRVGLRAHPEQTRTNYFGSCIGRS